MVTAINDDHIPVPSEHSPTRDMNYHPEAFDGAAVHEVDGDGAWIWSDTTAEVKQ